MIPILTIFTILSLLLNPQTAEAQSFPGHSIDAVWIVAQDSESVTINVNYNNTGPHANIVKIRAFLAYQNRNIWSVNSPEYKLDRGKATIPMTIRRINQGDSNFNSDQIIIQMLAGGVLSSKKLPYRRSWNTKPSSSLNGKKPSAPGTNSSTNIGGSWSIQSTDLKTNEQQRLTLVLRSYNNSRNRYLAYIDHGRYGARGGATSLNNELKIDMETKNGNRISGTLRILNNNQMNGTLSMYWTRWGNTSQIEWRAIKK